MGSLKIAIGLTLGCAVALFIAMVAVQKLNELGDFRLGAPWPAYTTETIEALIRQQDKARIVVVPLLFPLDLLFLACAGAALALISVACAPAGLSVSWFWLLVLPSAYLVSDFAENALLAGMLSGLAPVTKGAVAATHLATHVKWGSFSLASLQAIIVFGSSFVR
jgi:hypothetical protein